MGSTGLLLILAAAVAILVALSVTIVAAECLDLKEQVILLILEGEHERAHFMRASFGAYCGWVEAVQNMFADEPPKP